MSDELQQSIDELTIKLDTANVEYDLLSGRFETLQAELARAKETADRYANAVRGAYDERDAAVKALRENKIFPGSNPESRLAAERREWMQRAIAAEARVFQLEAELGDQKPLARPAMPARRALTLATEALREHVSSHALPSVRAARQRAVERLDQVLYQEGCEDLTEEVVAKDGRLTTLMDIVLDG